MVHYIFNVSSESSGRILVADSGVLTFTALWDPDVEVQAVLTATGSALNHVQLQASLRKVEGFQDTCTETQKVHHLLKIT